MVPDLTTRVCEHCWWFLLSCLLHRHRITAHPSAVHSHYSDVIMSVMASQIISVSMVQRLDWLLNRLFRRKSKNTSKLRVTVLCERNPPVTGGSPNKGPVTGKCFYYRSGAAADRRTPLKPGAQLDLASPYAVPRTRRTESPTSLNYAKLCVELNYTGAAIGEMWGDLVIRHIVLELFMLNRGFPRFRRESVCDRYVDGVDSALKGGYLEKHGT